MSNSRGFALPYIFALIFTITFVGVGTYTQFVEQDSVIVADNNALQNENIQLLQELRSVKNSNVSRKQAENSNTAKTSTSDVDSTPVNNVVDSAGGSLNGGTNYLDFITGGSAHSPDEVAEGSISGSGKVAEGSISGSGKVAEGSISGSGKIPLNAVIGDAMATGIIKGFGSVYSNGVRFLTHEAEIIVNGQLGTEDDLRAGMQIKIDGEVDDTGETGIAYKITFDYDYIGIVESIDVKAKTLVISGTKVVIDDELTVLDRISMETLAIGDSLGISGQINSEGNIVASYIARLANARDSASSEQMGIFTSFTGYIASANRYTGMGGVNVDEKRFKVGTKTISYANAKLVGFDSSPTENQYVFVEGLIDPETSIINAAQIEFRFFTLDDSQGSLLTVGGMVTSQADSYHFSINDQAIVVSTSTEIVRGDLTEIVLNKKLKVEGQLNSQGQLIATRIVFPIVSNVYLETYVIDVDPISKQATLMGMSLPVMITNDTLMLDNSKTHIHSFSLTNVKPGDRVKLYGDYRGGEYFEENDQYRGFFLFTPKDFYEQGNGGEVIATRFELIDDSSKGVDDIDYGSITVQGTYRRPTNHPLFFKIYGLLVTNFDNEWIVSLPKTEYYDENDAVMTKKQFLMLAVDGAIVRVEGRFLENWYVAPHRVKLMEQ